MLSDLLNNLDLVDDCNIFKRPGLSSVTIDHDEKGAPRATSIEVFEEDGFDVTIVEKEVEHLKYNKLYEINIRDGITRGSEEEIFNKNKRKPSAPVGPPMDKKNIGPGAIAVPALI